MTTEAPPLTGVVDAPCGCVGTVRFHTAKSTYVLVGEPCLEGHPDRVMRGVLVPFPSDELKPHEGEEIQ